MISSCLNSHLNSYGLLTVDGYQARFTNVGAGTDTWTIERVDNGSTTVLASGTQEYAANDKFRLRLMVGELRLMYKPSAVWTTLGTATDSTYTGTGRLSLTIEGTAATVDDFGGGEI